MWITVTRRDGTKTKINSLHIVWFSPDTDGSMIMLAFGHQQRVKESYEEIDRQISDFAGKAG